MVVPESSHDPSCSKELSKHVRSTITTDAGIVMVDGTFFGDSFEQDRSWDDWDDYFRDLGYPPKFYRGQDAGFDNGSSS